jgi:hypothetical protein
VDESHHDLLVRARAALAQPESQRLEPTDDELQKIADALRDEDDTLSLVEYARAVLARWGRPAKPEPQKPTQKEAVALYSEIMAVNNCQTLGEMAEHFACAVLARWGRPTVEPVPVRERPWEREGWRDVDGQCWMGDGGGGGFVPSWRLCKPDDSCLAWSLPHWALPVPNSYSTTPGNQ